jgi:hypothetical protein
MEGSSHGKDRRRRLGIKMGRDRARPSLCRRDLLDGLMREEFRNQGAGEGTQDGSCKGLEGLFRDWEGRWRECHSA